jgi:hypothetical protein
VLEFYVGFIPDRNTEALLDANNRVRVEIHVEGTRRVFMSFHQNVGQNHDVIPNKYYKKYGEVQLFWKKIFSCLIKHHVMKTSLGRGGVVPSTLNLGTRWI